MNQLRTKMLLLMLAEYYRTTLTEHQLSMYAEDLSILEEAEFVEAARRYRSDPGNKFMPLPAQLLALARPTITDDQQARDCVGRLVTAMGLYGWNNPERARSHMGELAWKVVEREGGWVRLCERTKTQDLPILEAQWRELAKALLAKSRAGQLDEAPGLAEPMAMGLIKLGMPSIKELEKKSE